MTYLRAKRKHSSRRIIGIIAVLIFVYVVLSTRVFDVFSGVAQATAIPAWNIQKNIAQVGGGFRALFADKQALLAENKRLKEEAEIASAKLLDRNLLLEENIELKELLGRDAVGDTMFATVLVGPSRSPYDTFIIDIGEDAGLREGDMVLYGGTIAIGTIAEVFVHSAKAVLFSSPGEEMDVLVGREAVSATAHGRGGGEFALELPRDTAVVEGDTIAVPGIATRLLGVVESIETTPSNPFKTILFKGPVNVFKLKWVEVAVATR